MRRMVHCPYITGLRPRRRWLRDAPRSRLHGREYAVVQQFSKETRELLDRADRAIDDAVKTREETRRYISWSQMRLFLLEQALSAERQRVSLRVRVSGVSGC